MNLSTPVLAIFDSSSEDGRIIIFWGVVTVLLWVYLWVALTGHSELSKKKDKEEKKDEEEEKEEGRKNQVMVVHNLKPSPWEAEASQILISSMSA